MKIELQATRIEGIADLHGHVDGVLADAEIQVVRKQRVELQAEQAALASSAPCCLAMVEKYRGMLCFVKTAASPNSAPTFVPPM